MSIDWSSLGLVTVVTILGTAFIITITSLGARLLDQAHVRRQAGHLQGLRVIETAAAFFIMCAAAIVLGGLWLLIPYFH